MSNSAPQTLPCSGGFRIKYRIQIDSSSDISESSSLDAMSLHTRSVLSAICCLLCHPCFISFHQYSVKDHLALHGLNFQCQCRGASFWGFFTSPTWGFVIIGQVVIPLSRPHGPSAPCFRIRWIKLENSDINRPKDYAPRTEFVGERSCNGDQRGYQDLQPGQKIR